MKRQTMLGKLNRCRRWVDSPAVGSKNGNPNSGIEAFSSGSLGAKIDPTLKKAVFVNGNLGQTIRGEE
jgi:hypothetical protein